jgi:hypothetical protein
MGNVQEKCEDFGINLIDEINRLEKALQKKG